MSKKKTRATFSLFKVLWKISLVLFSPFVLVGFIVYSLWLWFIDLLAKTQEYGVYDEQTVKRRAIDRQRERRKSCADFFKDYFLKIFG